MLKPEQIKSSRPRKNRGKCRLRARRKGVLGDSQPPPPSRISQKAAFQTVAVESRVRQVESDIRVIVKCLGRVRLRVISRRSRGRGRWSLFWRKSSQLFSILDQKTRCSSPRNIRECMLLAATPSWYGASKLATVLTCCGMPKLKKDCSRRIKLILCFCK